MVQKRIDILQATITKLIAELRTIDIKLDHYARTDRLAFGAHYDNYKKLDAECLHLMTELQTLELEV